VQSSPYLADRRRGLGNLRAPGTASHVLNASAAPTSQRRPTGYSSLPPSGPILQIHPKAVITHSNTSPHPYPQYNKHLTIPLSGPLIIVLSTVSSALPCASSFADLFAAGDCSVRRREDGPRPPTYTIGISCNACCTAPPPHRSYSCLLHRPPLLPLTTALSHRRP